MILNLQNERHLKLSNYHLSDVDYDPEDDLDFDEDLDFEDDEEIEDDDDFEVLDFDEDGADTSSGYYPYFRSNKQRYDDEY